MIDVQNLINNIKTVTSKALCTWGEFITFLSTELQYFKQKGGIQVNPPEVVLPDGVTTTTLISQSEMTQFVTNTLNVWLANIDQGGNKPLYDVDEFLYPHPRRCSADPNKNYITDMGELNYIYYSNYDSFVKQYLNPNQNDTNIEVHGYNGGQIINSIYSFPTKMNPIHSIYNTASYLATLTFRYLQEPLAKDLSNIANAFARYEQNVRTPFFSYSIHNNEDLSNYCGRVFDLEWDILKSNQYWNCNHILISLENYGNEQHTYKEMFPLLQVSKDTPWWPNTIGQQYAAVNVYFPFPRWEKVIVK